MLLNNFKSLISFYQGDKFIDVKGNTVTKANNLVSVNPTPSNNHTCAGVSGYFNYTSTTNSNSCTSEQGSYSWLNVVSSTSYNNDVHRHNGFTIFIGSGTKEPSANDYCLENPVTINVVGASCMHYPSEITTTNRIFYNNTDEDIEINEIGLYFFTTTLNVPVVMIGRKVLKTPVIIKKGEQATFSYSVDMSRVSFEEADD